MSEEHRIHHHGPSSFDIERSAERLRGAGERVTQARLRILEVLARDHEHLTADEIAAQLKEHGVHRATVFRSLEAFVAAGVATYHQVPAGATTYHLAIDGHLHAHCVNCHQVAAIDSEIFTAAQQQVRDQSGFLLELQRSSFVGLCAVCVVANERD